MGDLKREWDNISERRSPSRAQLLIYPNIVSSQPLQICRRASSQNRHLRARVGRLNGPHDPCPLLFRACVRFTLPLTFRANFTWQFRTKSGLSGHEASGVGSHKALPEFEIRIEKKLKERCLLSYSSEKRETEAKSSFFLAAGGSSRARAMPADSFYGLEGPLGPWVGNAGMVTVEPAPSPSLRGPLSVPACGKI